MQPKRRGTVHPDGTEHVGRFVPQYVCSHPFTTAKSAVGTLSRQMAQVQSLGSSSFDTPLGPATVETSTPSACIRSRDSCNTQQRLLRGKLFEGQPQADRIRKKSIYLLNDDVQALSHATLAGMPSHLTGKYTPDKQATSRAHRRLGHIVQHQRH